MVAAAPHRPGRANPALSAVRWMITGFLLSFLGSMVAEGALPGLIAAGVVAVAWQAVFRTVGMLLDMTTPVTMRLLERYSPGKLLVGSEAADVLACTVALVLISGFSLDIGAVLIGYLLVAAILPLVIDIAEELYIAQIVTRDEQAAVRFNTIISSSSATVGFVIAQPLGAFMAEVSIPLLLAANLALSAFAIIARTRANRLVPTVPTVVAEGKDDTEATAKPQRQRWQPSMARTRAWVRRNLALGAASPLISGLLSLIGGIYGTYLVLWIAGNSGLWVASAAIGLAAFGIGRVIGPLWSPWLAARMGASKGAALQAAAQTLTLLAGIVLVVASRGDLTGYALVIPALLVLAVLAGSGAGTRTLYLAVRQSRLSGKELSRAIGVGRSLAAFGTLIGVWLGLVLQVDTNPVPGLGLALIASIALTLFMLRSTRTETAAA